MLRSGEPLGEFGQVDHRPLVGSDPDLFPSFGRADFKLDVPPLDLCHLGFAVTTRPAGVAAKWRILTTVPTALSPGSR